MRLRGVNYDVGRVLDGMSWRPAFDPAETRRELEIIRDDLHCNAVRICGEDTGRVVSVAADALERGLGVWVSPELWDHSHDDTLSYVAQAASAAEELRRDWPGRVTFSVGSELTLFMQGIVPGDTFRERLAHPAVWENLRAGVHNEPLNKFLASAAAAAREKFHGDLTYASLAVERTDWGLFDIVSVDHYREAQNREWYRRQLKSFFTHGKPVAITEFGCCTFRGAAGRGARGWEIVDVSKMPPELDGDYIRDEAEQAADLTDLIGIFAAEDVDAAFVQTFVQPLTPYSGNPRRDLDMAGYALVRSYGNRLGEVVAALVTDDRWSDSARPEARRYPDMPWDPKESFDAVAAAYHRLAAGVGDE
jgi:hypothetical protein